MSDALLDLARSFYSPLETLGRFERIAEGELPSPERELLAHRHHMTVTVERHHGCPVDVRVLEVRSTPEYYSRVILLVRQRDSEVVQFGVMRIHWPSIAEEVRAAIRSEEEPLGRILIRHNVLREIHPLAYYRVECGEPLRAMLGAEVGYGRAARIDFDGQPAVEVIEILP